ncbi:MAG: restriction endonuclease subunit S, partial [Candidatus Yonathbacteria bacterium CG_4_9_14_0_2_um_filter_47_74]
MSKLLEQINESRITKRLGDLVLINQSSITNGFSYKEIEYIDTSAVTKNHFENPQILNINEAPSRAKRLLKDGDTILSTVRPNLCHYGFIKDPKPNTVASTGFVVLTPKNINPFYLYSYLTQDSITDTLSSIAEATTTTFPAFRPEVLSEMEIEIPDLPIQNKIAEILSAYDVKIENNNKITKNLEATAQTIFNEW